MRFAIIALGLVVSAAALGQVRPGPLRGGKEFDRRDLPQVLRLMGENLATWKFSGTRVMEIREGAQRKLFTEFVLRDGNKTRTWYPDDSPRAGEVVVEDGQQRKFYDPKRNAIIVTRMLKGKGAGTDRFMAIVGRNFTFVDEKADKVAGHNARVISVADKDRIFQRVWIDVRTGLPLKRELYDNVGARTGFFEYKEINYAPIIRPGDFDINVRGARVLTPYDLAKQMGERMGIVPLFLPRDRFVLENVMRPGQAGQFLHMSYATEEGVVSLFQAKGRVPMDRFGGERKAAGVSWVDNGYSFVLMGRMPRERLEALARELGMK